MDTETSVSTCDRDCDYAAPSDRPNRPGRDDLGRFAPGNYEAVTHALRAAALPPQLAHLDAEIAAWMGAALADEGNLDELSARRRALLENRGRIQRRIVQLDAALELRGLMDRRGRLRVAWLQRLEGLVNQARALDALLGLERKASRPRAHWKAPTS